MTAVVVALLAFMGVVLSALIAGGVTLAVQLSRWHRQNQLLSLWNRDLVDQIYRGDPPPPRAPPAGLFDH